MSTHSWTGSAEEGFYAPQLTFNSQVRLITMDSNEFHPAVYAIYLMQRLARAHVQFLAQDAHGNTLASYDPVTDQITAQHHIHEALAAFNLIADLERKDILASKQLP